MLDLTIIGHPWTWTSSAGFVIFGLSVLAILIFGPRYKNSLILKNKDYYTRDEIAYAEEFAQRLGATDTDMHVKKYHSRYHAIMIFALASVMIGLFFPGVIYAITHKIP